VSPRQDRDRAGSKDYRQPPPWLLPVLIVLVVVLAVAAAVTARARSGRPAADPTSQSVLPSTSQSVLPSTSAPPDPATTVRPSTSQPPTTATTTTPPTATTRAPTTTRPVSPLRRITPRPAGLAAQFDLGLGGADTDCTALEPPSAEPSIAGPEQPDLGLLYPVCFYNFSDSAPVQVTINGPDGSVERHLSSRDPWTGTAVLWWGTEPGDPLGQYEIEAVQKPLTARATFRLMRQRLPTLRVVQNVVVTDWVEAGTTVTVVLAGFRPGARVRLHTYHLPLDEVDPDFPGISTVAHPGMASYRSSADLTMDGRGELTYRIPTSRADPKGCYAFQTTPPLQALPGASHFASHVGPIDRFCLR
jgi:hypothetical protein